MLNLKSVVPYLLDNGLLDARTVVRHSVRVQEYSRRNLNYLVLIDDSGYFVKQGLGAKRYTVGTEALAYSFLAGLGSLRRYLVPLLHFDPDRAIEVFDLVPSATSFRNHYMRTGRFQLLFAKHVGRALADLHRRPAAAVPTALNQGPAECLSLHRPPALILDNTSRAGLKVVSMMQSASGLGEALDSAASDWRSEALIHCDMRWDNCLVFPPVGATRRTRLKLIDWELARWGDPAWDLGSVFAEYLGAWLTSIPTSAEQPPDQVLDLAKVPIERVHTQVNVLWKAYRAVGDIASDESPELRRRATRFAGARLIQSSFERADRSSRPSVSSVVLLQAGYNMLVRPLEASTHLLGLNGS